ncbi:MAG: hypothetical protein PHR35_22085, partial [Kiritimatiellae bacterium]|nr:hypothetical protein [Kiritimatiellia bacterium]
AGADAGKDAGGGKTGADAGKDAGGGKAGADAGKDAGGGKAGDDHRGTGAAAFDIKGFGDEVASLRQNLLADLGDLEIEPEDKANNQGATTFKDLAKDYPAITNAIVAIAERMTAPLRAYVDEQRYRTHREELLGALDGTGEGQVPGARTIADSPGFNAWYGEQPAAIQQLGASPERKDAARLIRFYLAEHPEAAPQGAGVNKGADDAAKRLRLGIIAAGSGGGAARAAADDGLLGDGQFISEEEAGVEFERLAKERAGSKK